VLLNVLGFSKRVGKQKLHKRKRVLAIRVFVLSTPELLCDIEIHQILDLLLQASRSLGLVLDPWRVLRETSMLVDLCLVLEVWKEDGEVVQKEVSQLEKWMKKLVRVELSDSL